MHDTITVGMDTLRSMTLVCEDTILCEGERTTIALQYPTDEQQLDSCAWSAVKEFNGQKTVMPASALNVSNTIVQLNSQEGQLTQNHIDSTWIVCSTSFLNGCNNHDSILIQTFPNYNFYDTVGICKGDSYSWCGMTFRSACDTSKHYYSQTECDSTRHLHLIVSDLSYNTDYVLDCKPHTWINGKTYSHDNDDTRDQDTVTLKNEWGCDSIVTLDFTFIPMKPIIGHNPEVATIDELTIELYDQSYGHDSRCWLLPNGRTSTDAETSIIFPLNGIDSMLCIISAEESSSDMVLKDTTIVKIMRQYPEGIISAADTVYLWSGDNTVDNEAKYFYTVLIKTGGFHINNTPVRF